jgi:16S rRNA C1402 (ribose-2'-O) methylase RsmI
MEEATQIISYVAYLLPAIVVGLVAYYFFKGHTANEEGRRRYLIQKEAQNQVIPMRLQAYERITLFLERIDPHKLLVRVKPFSDETAKYEELLIRNIEQEFEHNLTQQIYLTSECWNLVNATKNATIHVIRQSAMHEKNASADKMRESLLRNFMEEITPSQNALVYVRKEVSELF